MITIGNLNCSMLATNKKARQHGQRARTTVDSDNDTRFMRRPQCSDGSGQSTPRQLASPRRGPLKGGASERRSFCASEAAHQNMAIAFVEGAPRRVREIAWKARPPLPKRSHLPHEARSITIRRSPNRPLLLGNSALLSRPLPTQGPTGTITAMCQKRKLLAKPMLRQLPANSLRRRWHRKPHRSLPDCW